MVSTHTPTLHYPYLHTHITLAHIHIYIHTPTPLRIQIPACPRSVLDSDIVTYLTSDEARDVYAIYIDEHGVFWRESANINTSTTTSKSNNNKNNKNNNDANNNNNNNTDSNNNHMNSNGMIQSKDIGDDAYRINNKNTDNTNYNNNNNTDNNNNNNNSTNIPHNSDPHPPPPPPRPGLHLLDTGKEGWIFVIRGGVMFAHYKRTKVFPRLVHYIISIHTL